MRGSDRGRDQRRLQHDQDAGLQLHLSTYRLRHPRRGKTRVKIEAIVDKSQRSAKYTGATFLANAGLRVLVDTKPAIAHNKIILIDDEAQRPVLITGSFNFARAGQDKNAENILMIRNDRALVSDYRLNFDRRKAVSIPYARLDRR